MLVMVTALGELCSADGHHKNHLIGLVGRTSASRAEDLGFDTHLHRGDFFRL